MEEKQAAEAALAALQEELKLTSKSSALREVKILKKVVQSLEEQLAKERTKHQRATNKRLQENRQLADEVGRPLDPPPCLCHRLRGQEGGSEGGVGSTCASVQGGEGNSVLQKFLLGRPEFCSLHQFCRRAGILARPQRSGS